MPDATPDSKLDTASKALPPLLLAVDLGMRCGLACYGDDGRLRWYRSRHFGNRHALRAGSAAILAEHPGITVLALEGGGEIAVPWQRAAERRGLTLAQDYAEAWRADLLFAREQRHGADAKRHADRLAHSIISWSNAPAPTAPLRHDTAEAILYGLWTVLRIGWLDQMQLPDSLRLRSQS